jgi:hypothetical protein
MGLARNTGALSAGAACCALVLLDHPAHSAPIKIQTAAHLPNTLRSISGAMHTRGSDKEAGEQRKTSQEGEKESTWARPRRRQGF